MTPFDQLKPMNEIKKCICPQSPGILLVDLLTPNPINCIKCKNELDPQTLGFSEELVKKIVSWLVVYHSLYQLWLNSGEYEQWAKKKLLDKNGSVNKLGLETVKEINLYYNSYYWWFHDEEDGNIEKCPICNSSLSISLVSGNRTCEICKIIV